MKKREIYLKIADIGIRINVPDIDILTDMPCSDFLTDPCTADVEIDCKVLNEFPKAEGELIYHDKRNLIYRTDKAVHRYIGHFEQARFVKGARYCICYGTQNADVYELFMNEKMHHLSLGTLISGIGVEYLMARKQRVILHSSFISCCGQGVVFTAPSGTGKSTQAELWRVNRPLVQIINGDRSVLSYQNGTMTVHGLPFCGSSGIALNTKVPLRAIIVLRQGKQNQIHRLTGIEAIKNIYSECSVCVWDSQCVQNFLEILEHTVSSVPVYLLSCLPDKSAVDLLEDTLRKEGGFYG